MEVFVLLNKILIIEEDYNQIENLRENFKNFTSIEVHFAETGDLAVELLEKEIYSIIFLNMFASNYDGNEILDYIKSNITLNNTKVIIISELYNNYISQIIKRNNVDYFIHKPYSFERIIKPAIDLLSISSPQSTKNDGNKAFQNAIKAFLLEMNFKNTCIGYTYVKTAIAFCISQENLDNIAITKDVYPYVAKIHNVDIKCVERNLRHSINSTFQKKDARAYFKKLNVQDDTIPSNKEFIFNIAKYIKKSLNNNVA